MLRSFGTRSLTTKSDSTSFMSFLNYLSVKIYFLLFRSRLVLKILLQIFIISLFLISNWYSGFVTSFMLEPVRIPLMKTNEEFYKRKIKMFVETILKFDDRRKAMTDALASGLYYTITPCKKFKFIKERSCGADRKLLDKTYIVKEPFTSLSQNLFVPFSNPFVDKFQGKKKFQF